MPDSVAPSLRITIVTPAPPGSRGGNRATALRWAALMRQLGHRVRIATGWQDHALDVLVAVHAVKSGAAVRACRRDRPHARIVVVLAGTDVYPPAASDLQTAPADARASATLALADAIVALQPQAVDAVPQELRAKARTIVQSATAVTTPRGARFTAALLAHLRPVKQQLLAIEALAFVPAGIDVQLVLAGGRLDPAYAALVERAIAIEPRARWVGELPRLAGKHLLAASQVCVVPSSAEGGANVVSEAIAAGTPVLCSDVPGNLGLLGDDWPGAFPAASAAALGALLTRCVTDERFLDMLRQRAAALQPMVSPARERAALGRLLAELAAD